MTRRRETDVALARFGAIATSSPRAEPIARTEFEVKPTSRIYATQSPILRTGAFSTVPDESDAIVLRLYYPQSLAARWDLFGPTVREAGRLHAPGGVAAIRGVHQGNRRSRSGEMTVSFRQACKE